MLSHLPAPRIRGPGPERRPVWQAVENRPGGSRERDQPASLAPRRRAAKYQIAAIANAIVNHWMA